MFEPRPFELMPSVTLTTKGILFSVHAVTLEELEKVLGPAQEVGGTSRFWTLRIDGVLIGLEFWNGDLGVFSDSKEVSEVANKLGFSPKRGHAVPGSMTSEAHGSGGGCMTRFNPKPTFRLLAEIPDAGHILLSVSNCERSILETALGPPRWHEDPPVVPTASDYWAIAIDGHEILLEHTPDLLGVYSPTRDPGLICDLLGLDVAVVATYSRNQETQ